MFGRRKAAEDPRRAGSPDVPEPQDPTGADQLRAHGPWDISEVEDRRGYLDLGSLLVRSVEGMGVRLEVSRQGERPRAVNLDYNGSTVQLQAFAAPRTVGLWEEIRADLTASLAKGDGAPQAVEGTFGTELQARFSAVSSDGTRGYRPARFVGIDGPRWFLRAVVSGAAAIEPEASARFDEIIRSVIVRRGGDPMPPRDLLPLRVPEGVSAEPAQRRRTGRRAAQTGPAAASGGARPAMAPPVRGPESTEIR